MADENVMKRLQDLAGFPVVPGTLNVRLPRALERDSGWRYIPAVEISPDWNARSGQAGYFITPVMIAGRYRGRRFRRMSPENRDTRPTRSNSSARFTSASPLA